APLSMETNCVRSTLPNWGKLLAWERNMRQSFRPGKLLAVRSHVRRGSRCTRRVYLRGIIVFAAGGGGFLKAPRRGLCSRWDFYLIFVRGSCFLCFFRCTLMTDF